MAMRTARRSPVAEMPSIPGPPPPPFPPPAEAAAPVRSACGTHGTDEVWARVSAGRTSCVGGLTREDPAMSHLTTIEVHRPLSPVTRALLRTKSFDHVYRVGDAVHVQLGGAEATAVWDAADRCTVVTVQEPDRTNSVASAVFARLAELVDRFEIYRSPTGEVCYRL